ncbi:MAG TPA: heavy metal-associated domain-containing protein [Fimbriimonadales bacterium]|nr:heavy metal-associated domain-containing protein [Fimbriimonadales bacterium]
MQIILKCEDLHCSSCAESVKKALNALEGIERIEVDLDEQTVIVDFEPPLDEERIKITLEEAGFPPVPA